MKSILLTVLSIYLAAISLVTLQKWAAVGAIIAAISTVALNYYKYKKIKKDE